MTEFTPIRMRAAFAVVTAATVLALASGCAELRGREVVGGYVDDAAITAAVKSRMVEDKVVDADAIKVETVNGNVVLSGSARTPIERMTAESIAMQIHGVKSVQNELALHP